MIQAVFFDIDGTLISFKSHAILPATRDAINQLRRKGIKVVIATGRSMCDINNLEGIEFDGFITANGSCCIDAKGEVIDKHVISKESLERLALYLEAKPFSCSFVTDKGNFINYADDYMMALCNMVNIPPPPTKPLAEILTLEIIQLDAFINTERETELLTQVLTDCSGCRWHPIFTDINAKNCSKATGIERFLAYFGISREHSIAFGDGGNDISMLEYAAIGVAMGNAKEHVKAAADYVTASVDEDGIVQALKYFGLI